MADGAADLCDPSTTAHAWVRHEGDQQFIVFPAGFRMDAEQVIVRRDGGCIVLEPAPPPKTPETDAEWAAFWADTDTLRGDERLLQPEREPLEMNDGSA